MCFSILPVVFNMNIMSAKTKTNENLLSTKINNGHRFMIPKIDKLQGTSDNFFMTWPQNKFVMMWSDHCRVSIYVSLESWDTRLWGVWRRVCCLKLRKLICYVLSHAHCPTKIWKPLGHAGFIASPPSLKTDTNTRTQDTSLTGNSVNKTNTVTRQQSHFNTYF